MVKAITHLRALSAVHPMKMGGGSPRHRRPERQSRRRSCRNVAAAPRFRKLALGRGHTRAGRAAQSKAVVFRRITLISTVAKKAARWHLLAPFAHLRRWAFTYYSECQLARRELFGSQ